MRYRLGVAALAVCGLAATACSDSGADATSPGGGGGTTPSTCVPQGGARCPGPAPVDSALIGHLYLASRNQLDLFGNFLCGGRLHAKESGNRVVVTYIASRVRTGGMACAKVTLSVGLHRPLRDRTVIDSVTGHVLPVGVKPNS